jgi:hypothetical protein
VSLDEGLQQLAAQIRRERPGAVIWWIGDSNHSDDPRVSQHAPDDGRSGGPGDTPGEYDAIDVPKLGGVTDADLDRWFTQLHKGRDPRILYAIRRQKIFSSVTSPWALRTYTGKFHDHLHVSVNDRFKANRDTWKLVGEPVRTPDRITVTAGLPVLLPGDEDPSPAADGRYQHVKRVQVMLNWLDATVPDLDVDGVYGAKTRQKLAKVTGGTGRQVAEDEWRKLFGLYRP